MSLLTVAAHAQTDVYTSSGDLFENDERTISIRANSTGQAVWSERYIGFARASKIFFFDGTQTTQLTNNGPTEAIYSVFPQINDAGQIVWRTTTPGAGSDIWFFDSKTNDLVNLTLHIQDRNHPQISNRGEVVFAGREFVPDPADIYLWSGVIGELAQPVNPGDPGIQVFPQVAENGDLLWLTDLAGETWEVTVHDRSEEPPTPSSLLEDAEGTGIKVLSNLLWNSCQTFVNYEHKVALFASQGQVAGETAEDLLERSALVRGLIGCSD